MYCFKDVSYNRQIKVLNGPDNKSEFQFFRNFDGDNPETKVG